MDSFPTLRETFCDVYGPQCVSVEQDVMSAFENNFDVARVKLIVDETNRCGQQEISKCQPFDLYLSKTVMVLILLLDSIFRVQAKNDYFIKHNFEKAQSLVSSSLSSLCPFKICRVMEVMHLSFFLSLFILSRLCGTV
jgi:hypothetical protein